MRVMATFDNETVEKVSYFQEYNKVCRLLCKSTPLTIFANNKIPIFKHCKICADAILASFLLYKFFYRE